ncbi:MAG: bacteriohemerythrin [Colwellia sp.]|nr:bacteriohemerythrin [Colwellia sp.]
MNNENINKTDIVLVYQDLEIVESLTYRIKNLSKSYQAIPLKDFCIDTVRLIQPKVILFSTVNLITSIELYIELLESCNDTLVEHHSILLTNNKESQRAFVACENGLFDNYVIISPLNEPNRLSLILIKALELVSEHRGNGITKLLAEGSESLAVCIEKGAELRKSLQKNIEQCEHVMVNVSQRANSRTDDSNKTATDIEAAINTFSEQINKDCNGLVSELQHVKSLNEQAAVTADSQSSINKRKLDPQVKECLLKKVEKLEERTLFTSDPMRYKLLVADSSLINSTNIIDIFEKNNFEVTSVNCGEEAIEKYTFIKPDIIILECKFPDIDGIEVIKRIREMGSTTPVIAMTSDKSRSVINKWIPFGIGAHIIKPFTEEIILNTVLGELANPTKILKQGDNYDLVEWIPEYSVGNKLMDSHHKELFSLINEFLRNDNDFDALIDTFTRLLSYTKMHFKAEEQILIDNDYPLADAHIGKHKIFTDKLIILRSKLNPKNPDIQQRIGIYLYKWLANHILKSDMHYKEYFARNKSSALE